MNVEKSIMTSETLSEKSEIDLSIEDRFTNPSMLHQESPYLNFSEFSDNEDTQ